MTPFEFPGAIETDRLTLRLPLESDVDALFAYRRRDDVCQYLPHGAQTREQVVDRVAKGAASTTLAGDGDRWQIVVELPATERAPARAIGEIYLTLARTEHRSAEIGWVLDPFHHGQGYATEAAAAVLDLAFGGLGMHRVHAQLDPRNGSSLAVCRRLGMRQEAHFREDFLADGTWSDTAVWAILADEWSASTR